MRKTWQAINVLLNRRQRNLKPINKLKDPQSNNSVINDPLRIPNIVNKYFSSVGNNLATKLPEAKHPCTDYLCNSKSPDTSFFLKPVTPHEVKLEILSIPNNKSSGLYSCSAQLLKRSCDIISPVLANFLNKSVSLGAYPSKLIMFKVIPVYKADDETDACNYRPISLLSNFNRIFEKIMYNRMKVFIQKHQLLSSSQYGFAKDIQLNMLYLTWWNPSVPIWIKDFFLVGCSSTLRKLLTRWTIKYYLINLIITAFEELSISGFPRI